MKKIITWSVIVALIIAVCAALIHFWNNMYYLQILDQMDLPINDSIVDYYMIDNQEAGRYITGVENGSWKIIGKNKEEGIYGNIEIYVYDADARCIYAYKWDS